MNHLVAIEVAEGCGASDNNLLDERLDPEMYLNEDIFVNMFLVCL